MQTINKLNYDKSTDRWYTVTKNNEYPMHCGEAFLIKIGNVKLPCRLEIDNDWYVISNGIKIRLHPKEQYEIIIK